jgi:hypothetical protein
MGRAECAIPLRNFLGTPHGYEVATACGRMRIAWILGACTVLSLGLMFSYFVTKRQEEEYIADPTNRNPTVVVPLWLCALPLVYATYVYFTAVHTSRAFWESEVLNFDTSDMNKNAYLNYRAADARQNTQSAVAVTNTAIIGATSILGPFARGGV